MFQYGTPDMHHNGLNCGNNNTHKRTTSKPDPFSLYVPSAKRQQLINFWSMECQSSLPNPICSDISPKAMFDSVLDEKQMLECQEETPKLPTDLSEYDDDGNIANTPAYIKSLINLVQAPDEGYSDDCIPMSREESANQLPIENTLVDIDTDSTDMANNNTKIDDDETDDAFLNNLPTSVDDLQSKELHLKLERHYSSPIISRRQSPALYVGRSSLASESSYALGSAHSVVSDDEDLDAEDLEVAMINQSFEEQQKQSMLYEGSDLKSLFYSMPNQKLSESALDEANLAYILNSSNPSPPRKVFECTDGGNTSKNEYDSFQDLMITPSAVDYDTDDLASLLTPKSRNYIDCASASNTNFSNSFKTAGDSPPTLDEEFSSDGLNTQMENMILRGEFESNRIPNATSSKKNSIHEVESAFFDSLSATCETPETLATEAAEALAKNVVASLFNSDSSPSRSFGVEEHINLTDSLCKTLGFLSDSEPEEAENENLLKEKATISTVDSGADLTSSSSQVDFNELSKIGNDEQKVPESVLDSWEDWDDSEMEQKIMDAVKMKSQKSPIDNVLDVPSTSDWNLDVLPHVLEASNFHAKTTDDEINDTLSLMGCENAWSKRVDDTHALIVFPSKEKAIEALMSKRYSCIKLRPLPESAAQTKEKAIAWKNALKPNIPRPATNASVARRIVENTLGMRSSVSKEQRLKEQEELKLARASKKLKQSLWGDAD